MSLIEVLISLGLMALALLALISVLTLGRKQEAQSTDRLVAWDVAELELERAIHEVSSLSAEQQELFWSSAHPLGAEPWKEGLVEQNGREYRYELYHKPITNRVTGDVIGVVSGQSGLQKFDIRVEYGPADRLSKVELSKLVEGTYRP